MAYEELIKYYPWIDLAWEVFKGVSPTLIALVTIFITEFFVRRRNDIYKKREMELQYLEKILSWVHETRRNVFEISNSIHKVLRIDAYDRVSEFNKVMGQITEMNKSAFILCDTYEDISLGMGYDFKFEQFKDSIKNYSKTINDIGVKYLEQQMDIKTATEEINYVTVKTSENIKETTSLLVEKISQLYRG